MTSCPAATQAEASGPKRPGKVSAQKRMRMDCSAVEGCFLSRAPFPPLCQGGRRGTPAAGRSEREAPGVLRVSALLASQPAPSGQGKAGALWETAFPLLHPLPSPRSTPSFEVSSTRRIPSRSAFRESLRYGYPAPRASPQHTHHAGLTTRGLQGVTSPGEVLRETTSREGGFRPEGWGQGSRRFSGA